jgi:hypothetical protein
MQPLGQTTRVHQGRVPPRHVCGGRGAHRSRAGQYLGPIGQLGLVTYTN